MYKHTARNQRFQLLYSISILFVFAIAIWIFFPSLESTSAKENIHLKDNLATMTFIGNVGNTVIPDNNPTGLNVTFPVSGLPSGESVTNVSLELTMNHTWLGDLTATLFAPPAFGNSHIIFKEISDTTGGGAGDPSNFLGTYTFNDAATGDIWVITICPTCGNAFNIPEGAYRTSAPLTGALTLMNPAFQNIIVPFSDNQTVTMKDSFKGMPTNLANGTWRFNINDNSVDDFGNVTAARLTLTTQMTTAASVSVDGRALSSTGRGLNNVVVSLFGGSMSQPLYARTNQFGYFNFNNIVVGETYILSVSSKRYTFKNPTQVFTVQENLNRIEFIAN